MKDVLTRVVEVHLTTPRQDEVTVSIEVPADADVRPHLLAGQATVPTAIVRCIRRQVDVMEWRGYTYDATQNTYQIYVLGMHR